MAKFFVRDWKILRNTLRKTALFASGRPTSIILKDVLELKEEELILLQGEIQQTSDVLTLKKLTEVSVNEHEVMRHSSRRRNRRFVEAG